MTPSPQREEREVLTAYLVKNRLKRSSQREAILDAFVKAGHHVNTTHLTSPMKSDNQTQPH